MRHPAERFLDLLNFYSSTLGRLCTGDRNELGQTVAALVSAVLGCRTSLVFLGQHESSLVLVGAKGLDQAALGERPAGDPFARALWERAEHAVVVERSELDPALQGDALAQQLGGAWLVVPIRDDAVRNEERIGLIVAGALREPIAPDLALIVLDILASFASFAIASLRALSRLRESEERQRLAVEAGRIGMWFWDLASDELVWTPLCREIHGVAPGEALSYARFIASVHPDDRARVDAEVRSSVDERTLHRSEHRVVWPDGSVRWLVGVGQAFYLADGRPERMVGVAIDVTAQKLAEQDRAALLERERAALAEARTAARAKDEFLAVLSHELRTPMQAVLGWTQMLRPRAHDARMVERGLATIERNATAQAQIIEDLLDVSRIVAGKLRLERKSVDLRGVIMGAVDSARSLADAKSIGIDATLGSVAGVVLGDSARLQQVVTNVLTNAVKFTPRGGLICVRLDREGAAARIVVEDTGCGMSPELLPHVFDRFRQGDSGTTRRQTGLGLGLAIVHHLVEMHGGTVKAESPGEGRGATFTVTLPVVEREDGGARAGRLRARSAGLPMGLEGVRVLVVDDDPDACELFDLMLHEAGADVRTARSVRAALGELASFCPDLLLSDIFMPEEDGYVLIREVRARESADAVRIPVIAVTAFASAADRDEALARGFDAHLAKPASARDLATLAASLLRRAPG